MKKKEVIIIAVIIMIAIVSILFRNTHTNSQKNIQIFMDNEHNKDIIFDKNTKASYTVEASNGYNIILIENGIVKIIEADCPNQVCVHTKAISEIGEMIVCLPHRVVVKITERGR